MISNKLRIGAIFLVSSPHFAKAADAMNDREVGGVVGGVYSGNRGGPGLAAGRYGSPGGELGGGDRFGGGGYYYYGTGMRQFNGIPAGGGYAGYGEVVVRGPGAWNGGAVYPSAAGYAWRHRFGWNGYADDWDYGSAGGPSGFGARYHGFGRNYPYEYGHEHVYYRRRLPDYHGWAGPGFRPYAYQDIYIGAFSRAGYYNPIWEYGYGDIYGGLFSPDGYGDAAGYPPVGGRPASRATVGDATGHNGVGRTVRRGETVQPPYAGPVTKSAAPSHGGPVAQLAQPPTSGGSALQPAEPPCGGDTKEMAAWPIEQFHQLIMPNGEQQAALDELDTASAKAAQMIKAACPAAPAFTATGRLESMEVRIEAMRHAIEIVHGPMDKFYALLTPDQKARLAAGLPAANRPPMGRGSALAQNCAAANAVVRWPTAQIEKAVRPTGEQTGRLAALKEAAAAAAARLAACQPETQITPPARLAGMSERLDAMLLSVKEVHATLDAFYTSLSDEQKARFDAIGRTAAAH